jgi:hypothetical protein
LDRFVNQSKSFNRAMSQEESEAIGIAKTLVDVLFPALANRNFAHAIQFYAEHSTILFQGDEVVGRTAIWDYLKGGFANLGIKQIRVNACEAQPIPDSNFLVMIVVVGVVQLETDKVGTFHSALYVDADSTAHTAFVSYHSLHITQ